MGLADQALAAGLSSTASTFYGQLLADPKLSDTDKEKAGLGLSAAYIERTRTAEAKATLKFLPKSARKNLREAMVALVARSSTVTGAAVSLGAPSSISRSR